MSTSLGDTGRTGGKDWRRWGWGLRWTEGNPLLSQAPQVPGPALHLVRDPGQLSRTGWACFPICKMKGSAWMRGLPVRGRSPFLLPSWFYLRTAPSPPLLKAIELGVGTWEELAASHGPGVTPLSPLSSASSSSMDSAKGVPSQPSPPEGLGLRPKRSWGASEESTCPLCKRTRSGALERP